MVYVGKPSRGCKVCRNRRIKCDEAEPSCSYCLSRQLICPGYKTQFDVAWRDQNAVAESSVRRRQKAADNASKKLVKSSSPRISVSPKQDHKDYAVNFFMSSYIVLPEGIETYRGFLDCLYPVWAQADSKSPLKIAVSAVATYLLEAWSELKPATGSSLSTPLYLKGVASLRRSLETPGVGDDVLLAILMLQMYENLRSFSTAQFISKGLHVTGAIALVRQRSRTPFTSEISQRLLLGTRNQIVGRALKSSEAIPLAVTGWTTLTPDVTKTMAHRLDDLNTELANLQSVFSRLDNGAPAQHTVVLSLLEHARQLDLRFVAEMTTAPESWCPIRVSGPECIPESVRSAGLYQGYCDIYPSIFVANLINEQRCSRIKIHSTILTCLHRLDKNDGDTALSISIGVIQELADDICACIPYHLGDRMNPARLDDKTAEYPHITGVTIPDNHRGVVAAYSGWFLAGILVELLSLRAPLRDGQRLWVGGQMQRLKRIYDIQPSGLL